MRNRKSGDAAYRDNLRSKAKDSGMSTKAYLASRWSSVGWNYAVETIRRRCKSNGVDCTINANDLQELWELQNGICPLTGWEMSLRKTGSGLTSRTVSVDRRDQSIGYVKENIRLVCFITNNARYTGTDDELLEFCKAVVKQSDQVCSKY